MSETQSNLQIRGNERKSLEEALLQKYREKCASYALNSISFAGIIPRFKDLCPNTGDQSIFQNQLEHKYEFTPAISVIATWTYEYFGSNIIKDQYNNLEEFVTEKISLYLQLTTGKNEVDNEKLNSLIDRVVSADPLYEFLNDPEVKRIKISQGHIEEVLSQTMKTLTEDLPGSAFKRYFYHLNSSNLTRAYSQIVLEGETPTHFTLLDTALLNRLTESLVDNLDIDNRQGYPPDLEWQELEPWDKYPLLAECSNLPLIEKSKSLINQLLQCAGLEHLSSES